MGEELPAHEREGGMASVRDVCEQRQESRRQNRRQLCKNSCQSERMDWQRSVCTHSETPWSHSTAVFSADKSLCRVINLCIPSSTISCLKTEVFPQVFPLERPRTAVSIRSWLRIARQQHETQSLMRKMPPLQFRFATSRKQS